jgi:transcriptional regulator with XRE-family HTH domain
MKLQEVLINYRTQNGLTQKELAERIGVKSPTQVSRWENGRVHRIVPETAEKIAVELGIPVLPFLAIQGYKITDRMKTLAELYFDEDVSEDVSLDK